MRVTQARESNRDMPFVQIHMPGGRTLRNFFKSLLKKDQGGTGREFSVELNDEGIHMPGNVSYMQSEPSRISLRFLSVPSMEG